MTGALHSKKWYITFAVAMVFIIIFVAIFASVTTIVVSDDNRATAECYIDLNDDLTFQHPLILDENGREFLNPGPKGIYLAGGEKLMVACTGGNNHLAISAEQQELILECVDKNVFITDYHGVMHKGPFKDYKCTGYPESKARKTGKKCSGNYLELEIGFETSKGFISLITTCFNDAKKDSLYSAYKLLSTIGQQQSKVPRPESFHEGEFYSGLLSKPNTLYTKNQQLAKVATLLKSDDLARKYIKLHDDEYFLSRGHLTAKADFLYGAQQRATFYFINVAPQWQIFNKENWNILEQDVRAFASNQKLDLTVYTGVWGSSQLPDVNEKSTSLYLYLDKKGTNHQLSVPEIYWKVLYHAETRRAVAFVGHNNPYELDIAQKEHVCKDICSQINWLHWAAENVQKGYSYCCSVEDLAKTVTYLPELEVTGLLT